MIDTTTPMCEPSLDTLRARMWSQAKATHRPHGAKLYPGEADHIRKLYAEGMTQQGLAARYRVSVKTIHNTVNRKTWKQAA